MRGHSVKPCELFECSICNRTSNLFLRLIRENPRVSDLASLSVHVVSGSSLLKSAWVGLYPPGLEGALGSGGEALPGLLELDGK